MGAWADLDIDNDVLEGIVPEDFSDNQTGDFDESLATTAYQGAAKRYLKQRLTGVLAPVLMQVDDGNVDTFLDTLAASTQLADFLQLCYCWSLLILWYRQQRVTIGHVYHDSYQSAKEEFDQALNDLRRAVEINQTFIDAVESASSDSLKSVVLYYI